MRRHTVHLLQANAAGLAVADLPAEMTVYAGPTMIIPIRITLLRQQYFDDPEVCQTSHRQLSWCRAAAVNLPLRQRLACCFSMAGLTIFTPIGLIIDRQIWHASVSLAG